MAPTALRPEGDDFSEVWIEGEVGARWRSVSGHGPGTGAVSSGSSILEVEPDCRLPRHTDSAEETIVVCTGVAEVVVEDERRRVAAGGLAVVPIGVPHEVHNAGEETLRFVAVYADTDVVTRYEQAVQPSGSRERYPVG